MAEEKLSATDYHMGQLRYHRAMAVARAGNDDECAYHTSEAIKALNSLRQIALENAEAAQ